MDKSIPDSRIEEAIACLWSILWALLWIASAPIWLLWAVGIKALHDHFVAIVFAIRDHRYQERACKTLEARGYKISFVCDFAGHWIDHIDGTRVRTFVAVGFMERPRIFVVCLGPFWIGVTRATASPRRAS